MKRVGDDIIWLLVALGNMGTDEHIDAGMPGTVEGPSDERDNATDGAEQGTVMQRFGHAKAQTHGLVSH